MDLTQIVSTTLDMWAQLDLERYIQKVWLVNSTCDAIFKNLVDLTRDTVFVFFNKYNKSKKSFTAKHNSNSYKTGF